MRPVTSSSTRGDTYDTCSTQLTAGQGDRMRQQWLHWRVKVGSTAS